MSESAPTRTSLPIATILTVVGFICSVSGTWGTYQVLSYRVAQLEERTSHAEAEHDRAASVEQNTALRLQRVEDSLSRIEAQLKELREDLHDRHPDTGRPR